MTNNVYKCSTPLEIYKYEDCGSLWFQHSTLKLTRFPMLRLRQSRSSPPKKNLLSFKLFQTNISSEMAILKMTDIPFPKAGRSVTFYWGIVLWAIVCHWLHWLLALWMAWVLGWPIRSLSCTDPAARSKIMPQTLGLSWKISSKSPKNQVHDVCCMGMCKDEKPRAKTDLKLLHFESGTSSMVLNSIL